jgi:thioredoxin-like negative regulator of GroEL
MSPQKREAPLELVLYTRAGCHLCEEMLGEIGRARLPGRVALREVDVDSDPELAERYGRSIPVLELAGRPAFKGRLTAAELRRKVERALRDPEAE